MKIGFNYYLCEFCLYEFEYRKVTTGDGKGKTTSALNCPSCKRKISQRTSEGKK